MLALACYERDVCECGFHSSLATDVDNFFTFETTHCPVCAGAARYARIQHAEDEAAERRDGKELPPGVKRAADGRRTFIRQMSDREKSARSNPRRGAG